jgi:c(7)-type cytochrome triheme protein
MMSRNNFVPVWEDGMKKLFALILGIATLSFLLAVNLAEDKKPEKKDAGPPEKLEFDTKHGLVTYDHAKHLERAEGDCTVCHDKFWPMETGDEAPLKFKEGLHRTAETQKTSCGFCHHQDGKAFPSKGNCKRCHVAG